VFRFIYVPSPLTVEAIADELYETFMMLHTRFCSHILNFIVKDGLDVLKSAIENIHESVAFWTATPKRVEKFEEIAKFQKVKM
jgi:hypothetical protein